MTAPTCMLPSSAPSQSIDWADLLASCRSARSRSPPLTFDAIRDEFAMHLPSVATVIEEYCATVGEHQPAALDNDGEEDKSKQAERKVQILTVRNALRFAVSCLSLGSAGSPADENNTEENDSTGTFIRRQIQKEAVVNCNLHRALAQALQCRNMDTKSQLLAARLLSNLVTGNEVTSQLVIKDIAPSPSEAYRTKQLLTFMSLSESDTVGNSQADSNSDVAFELNWVDMIACAARGGSTGRETLAAVVAALFNSLVAIQDSSSTMFADISSDKALICAFVRHILPADTIKPDGNSGDGNESTTGDDATEWITLLLAKLACYGHFPSMYQATGVANTSNDEDIPAVTPEQIVLLHCIAHAVDEWASDTSAAEDCPMGGASGQQTILKSCQFLADQSKTLRQTIRRESDCSTEAYTGERSCRLSAYLSMLEILGTMLSSDDSNKAKDHVLCRIYLGRETSLLQDVAMELGILVDELSAANRGIKARELRIDDHDQRLAVALVRLIGNICYKCTSNQDKVRETEVPFSGGTPAQAPDRTVVVRCGLHVLLSCTSFSYGCFTLREWALVAIRNVLDGNQQNQDMVAQLEAQKTVDTPELNKMGVKTVIDDEGKVRVEPRW